MDEATAQLEVLWNAPLGIAFVDQELRILRLNRALAEMKGLPLPEAHSGKLLADVLPPGEASRDLIERARRVLVTGQPLTNVELEWGTREQPGQHRFSRVSCHPVHDGVEVVGLCVYVEDITERILVEEARLVSEAGLRRLFDSNLIGILVWERTGRILDANGRLLEMLGYRREDLKSGGLDWLAITPPDDVGAHERGPEELFSSQVPSERELVCKDGRRVLVLLVGAFFEGSRSEGITFVLDITEQKHAREALRESELRLRGVVAALSEGIVFHDASGAIGFSNAAACRLLGLTQDQLHGRTSFDPRWQAVKEDGSPYPGEEHPVMLAQRTGTPQLDKVMGIYRPDGSRVWLSINALPLSGPDGRTPRGMVASFFDITGRKETEAALRVSEERLRMAMDSAAIGTWDFNPVSLGLLWDSRTRALFGLPPDASADYGVFLSGLHPEDRERTEQAIQAALRPESGGHYDIEYRTVGLQDGVERWLAAKGRAWFDDKGQAVRFVGTVLEITQRKRTEASARFLSEASRLLAERLDRPEEMLQRVARLTVSTLSTYCIMIVVQEDGGLSRVAGAHRDASKEVFIRASSKLGTGAREPTPLLEVVRTGRSSLVRDFTPEVRQRYAVSPEHLDVMNTLDACSMMCVPMKARGQVVGLMLLAAAAPQRRYDEQDLVLADELAQRVGMALENIRLFREAQHAVGLRDEFLSIASHELKTPLTSLKLQHALIDRFLGPETRAAVGPRLSAAIRQVERLSSLVGSLLDVSRIGAGRLTLEPIDMELTQLIREVMDRFSEVFAVAECTVDFPATPPVRGYWDPLRLDQVIVNLLSNAAKYGAGKPIHVRVEVEGAFALVMIQDQGIGIAPDDLPRLFSRFGRAVSERHYGGLGLGLFISRQIIEAMGGSIRVESWPSRGSTFTVELPLRAGPPKTP
ncbi:PAS domain S-box protein [Archangium violaceum]|uniref:PAS domain-containing sensor histidine kinase n=1 Tax=Archangium violaceum TaxID=83451 RepID=UPI0019512A26|nr:PAS domain S-box protein [Archangium violaceum]QRN99553.1 PAS domain S-box protein [Archangium violaceum]